MAMVFDERPGRTRQYVTWGMAFGVFTICAYGFGNKFLEFIYLFRGDIDGVFAISPILNYLLASLGFACLFFCAMTQGMFHDVERPKFNMLETEELLDAKTRQRQRQQRPDWQ